MKIRTKFKRGQFVWVIDINNDKWKVIDKFKVLGITATVDCRGKDVDYELEYKDNQVIFLNESICFATKKEAQKECEKRNGNKTCNN